MAIANPDWAIAGLVHTFAGVAWVGMHIVTELLIVPEARKAQTLADMPMMRAAPKISMFNAVMGFATLITGLVYLFLKFGTDFSRLAADPEPRTVLIALGVVLLLMVFGMTVLRKRAEAIGKRAATLPPLEPLPADFKAELPRLELFLHIQTAGVFLALALMILAIHGGI